MDKEERGERKWIKKREEKGNRKKKKEEAG